MTVDANNETQKNAEPAFELETDDLTRSRPVATDVPADADNAPAGSEDEYVLEADEPVASIEEEKEETPDDLTVSDAAVETQIYAQYASAADKVNLLTRHPPMLSLFAGPMAQRIMLYGGAAAIFFLMCMNFWGGMHTPGALAISGLMLLTGAMWKLTAHFYAEREYQRLRAEYDERVRAARENVQKMSAAEFERGRQEWQGDESPLQFVEAEENLSAEEKEAVAAAIVREKSRWGIK